MSLGARLRDLRANKKISLQAVADAVGVSKPHVWELEKGKTKNPSLELLKKLASFYSVSLDFIAGQGVQKEEDLRYNALLRKIDPENMSDADFKTVQRAIDFALTEIKARKEVDD